MPITVQTSTPEALEAVIRALACWQRDGLPVQLHPGDLGWHGRFGADVLVGSLRVWSRDDEIVAMGLVDGDVIRMALAPSVDQDDGPPRSLAVEPLGLSERPSRFKAMSPRRRALLVGMRRWAALSASRGASTAAAAPWRPSADSNASPSRPSCARVTSQDQRSGRQPRLTDISPVASISSAS
jgi:hypothetical protein